MKTLKKIAIIIFVIALFYFSAWIESHYTKKATVVNVKNNVVTVIDNSNNIWDFKGDGFYINDKVELLMNNSQTDCYIFDDVIENVKKI